MTKKFLICAAIAGVLAAGSCEQDVAEVVSSSYPGVRPTKEKMEDTSINIDGKDYVVRQNRFVYPDGRPDGLGWAIVDETGKVISCDSPTPAACERALARSVTAVDMGDDY